MVSVALAIVITAVMVYVGIPAMGYLYLVLRVVTSKHQELPLRQPSAGS